MSLTPPSSPQFDTAEFPQPSNGSQCKLCGRSIDAKYYRVNSHLACPACAERIQAANSAPVDHSKFVRALIFGGVAAVAGMALYAAFEIGTGFTIGYAALAVGWMVAKAMLKGSGGIGGRHYQIAAALLTYMAVSTAAVPVALWQNHKESTAVQTQATTSADINSSQSSQPAHRSMSFGGAVLLLLGLGLASPFLELSAGLGGVIGLVILYVGIQIAWRMTAGRAKLDIQGPYEERSAAASAT